jgi:hypothetical protein
MLRKKNKLNLLVLLQVSVHSFLFFYQVKLIVSEYVEGMKSFAPELLDMIAEAESGDVDSADRVEYDEVCSYFAQITNKLLF